MVEESTQTYKGRIYIGARRQWFKIKDRISNSKLSTVMIFSLAILIIIINLGPPQSILRPLNIIQMVNMQYKGIDNVFTVQNLTPPSATILMYNKVPKCGSKTMVIIIERMGKINNFDVHHTFIFPRQHPKEKQEEEIQKIIQTNKTSLHAWKAHNWFFEDVGNYDGMLVWMNIVRDPVDRFISHFFWERERKQEGMISRLIEWGVDPEEFYNQDLNKCAAADHPLCTWTIFTFGERQLSFFCGQDPACSDRNNRWSLQRAIYNVEKYYSVVGLYEEHSMTLALLEAYIPKFFQGLAKIDTDDISTHPTGIQKKDSITNATKALLRNNLQEDYEFYEFVKQRFYSQAKTIGLL